MFKPNTSLGKNKSILSINRKASTALGLKQAAADLQAFARSTRINVNFQRNEFQLRGTCLAHHDADPYLNEYMHLLPAKLINKDLAGFHAVLEEYDICAEDSWSGYFVSQWLKQQSTIEPLIFIHLDDHTDMMSTLLTFEANGLNDPGSGLYFDPAIPADWVSAISSGAIGIGSFVTALYYLQQPVHVLHLNHNADSNYQRHYIDELGISHPLLPKASFAAIQKSPKESDETLGTYISSTSPNKLLQDLPQGRIVAHIDLDYFINDFNGNIGQEPAQSVEEMRKKASLLMTKFFDELRVTGTKVERWIIGTSPGFCSARHWEWLLKELGQQIQELNQANSASS